MGSKVKMQRVGCNCRLPTVYCKLSFGGGVWESNPPEPALTGSRTVLKTAPVTRPGCASTIEVKRAMNLRARGRGCQATLFEAEARALCRVRLIFNRRGRGSGAERKDHPRNITKARDTSISLVMFRVLRVDLLFQISFFPLRPQRPLRLIFNLLNIKATCYPSGQVFEAAAGFLNLPRDVFGHRSERVASMFLVRFDLEHRQVKSVLLDALDAKLDCA